MNCRFLAAPRTSSAAPAAPRSAAADGCRVARLPMVESWHRNPGAMAGYGPQRPSAERPTRQAARVFDLPRVPDGSLPPILQLILTFLPILTIGALILFAAYTRGTLRVAGLILIPLLGAVLLSVLGSAIAYNGNLLFAVLAALYLVFLCIYYPGMAIWGIVVALRARTRRSSQPDRSSAG